MGVVIATTRAAANTVPGTQDFTAADLGGLTPVAAFFTIGYGTSDGTPAADAELGIGATDGTNQWSISTNSEDGVGTTDTSRHSSAASCMGLLLPGSASDFDCVASFDSFISNGVRVDWTGTPNAAYLVTVTFIAGTDAGAYAGSFSMPTNVNDTSNITGVGFELDFGLFASVAEDDEEIDLTIGKFGFGAYANDGADSQGCWATTSANGEASSLVSGAVTGSYAIGAIKTDDSGDWDWAGIIDTPVADGFTVTTKESGSSDNRVFFLAVKTTGTDVWLDIIDTPTSTGNQVETGPGFTPQFVMQGVTHMTALDTSTTDGTAGSSGISVMDADEAYCTSIQDEDAAATTNTQSLSDDAPINLPQDDGSAGIVSAFVSFDALGWTENYTTVMVTSTKCWALAVEAVSRRIFTTGVV